MLDPQPTSGLAPMDYDHDDTLYPVSAEELRDVWVQIRDRVTAISEKCDENWIAEDVFHDIIVGNAALWTSPDCGGFVVLRKASTTYSNDLFVWLAYKDRAEPASYYLPQLLEIARTNECSRVTFESPRPWDKILPEAKRGYTFAIDVGG